MTTPAAQKLGIDFSDTHQVVQLIKSLQKINGDLRSSFEELITVLTKLSETISFTFEVETVKHLIVDLAHNIIPYKCAVLLSRNEKGLLEFDTDKNLSAEIRQIITEELDAGTIDWAIKQHKPIIMPEITMGSAPASAEGKNIFVLAPMITMNEVMGVLILYSAKSEDEFRPQDLELLNILTSQAATSLKNASLYTKMEEANNSLELIKNYLSNILESLPVGIIVLNPTGEIRVFNKTCSKFFEIPPKDVIAHSYRDVFNIKLTESIRTQLKYLSEGNDELKSFEIDYPLANQQKLPLGFTATVLKEKSGQFTGLIYVISNLSETREIERLKELDKMKSEILSSVSHELRTPLTSIKAYSETLMDLVGTEEIESQQDFLNIIISESDRLMDLINNLLDLSRLESGQDEMKLQPVIINDLLKKVTALLREYAARQNIKILLELPSKLPTISADSGKLEQVFINIVSNAIKYNRPDGQVIIKAVDHTKQGKIEISFKDTGIGIPADSISNIFDKFFRIDSSFTSEISGTGLGLAIVSHIIKSHNGRITVDSVPDQGSTFHIFLPLNYE